MAAILIEDTIANAEKIASECAERGYPVWTVPSLYHIPHDSELWEELAAISGDLVVASTLYPRPAECVLRSHGLGDAGITVIHATDDTSASDLIGQTGDSPGTVSGSAGKVVDLSADVAERWYPVLDYSRCTACGACFQFCIFGVYERDDDGAVIPVQPDNCKPGCPACARICPNSAIMFPLCDDTAIAGAPGEFVEPDGQARQMYYMRTGAECSECGGSGEFEPVAEGRACPECGRPMETDEADATVLGEIDALIDELDDLAGGEAE
jgi:Pyruvate/2-oxoacid:ferredoxin oxidoreductase delta subunit